MKFVVLGGITVGNGSLEDEDLASNVKNAINIVQSKYI